jgi:hypothetical protein
MEGRGGGRIDWRALASVAQWKSTSVLRSWLGVRVPPGARTWHPPVNHRCHQCSRDSQEWSDVPALAASSL